MFGNLLHTIPDDSFNPDDNFAWKLYDVNRASFNSHQFCYSHNGPCKLFNVEGGDADFENAGLPCTDQSGAGKQLFEEGDTAPVFMAHAKRHCELRTPLVVIENVPDM
jgi:site-specific DNA-cytosine methylase